MTKKINQMAVRFRSLADGDDVAFKWESSLDKILAAGNYAVEIEHNGADVGLPIEGCGTEHSIVGTLVVTDSGALDNKQGDRVMGQVLTFTLRESKETSIYTRTYAGGEWGEWCSLARTGMYDEITNADALYSTVTTLAGATKEFEKNLQASIINYNEWKGSNAELSLPNVLADDEFVKMVKSGTILTFKNTSTTWKRFQYTAASAAAADVKSYSNWKELSGATYSIMQAVDANRVQISTTGENGGVKDILNIAAATTERAGVMSADMFSSLSIDIDWIENVAIVENGRATTNNYFKSSDYLHIPFNVANISVSGYIAGSAFLLAFYDAAKSFISGYGDFDDAKATAHSCIHYSIPDNARYFRVCTSKAYEAFFCVWGDKKCNAKYDALLPLSVEWIDGEAINRGGKILVNAAWSRSDYMDISNVAGLTLKSYISGTFLACAFYDTDYKYISGIGDYGYSVMTAIHINVAVPAEAKYMRVSTAVASKDDTVFLVNGMRIANNEDSITFDTFATQTIPVQFYRKQSGDSLRVLCFGSSWLTNTWWYLNKLTQAVGINATIKCYFSSACPFSKWVDRYEGKEETGTSTDFRRFDSVNGSDWSVEYVTDTTEFKHSLEEDWDVIIFQQGSSDSTNWDSDNGYANHYQKLMSYVKRSAKPWTVICYNNTWTPKLGAGSTQTKEAQQKWQELNNENCIKFTNAVGLSNFVIPCGAAVWALRNDSVITDADDFMKDDLHIKNGLPMYLTGLTLFRAVVTPFYGIDIDDIAWLPDESTQKNPASGSSWMSVDSEQGARVKQMVKLAFSNRYGFYTL